jgi:flavin-binding protein dodecin
LVFTASCEHREGRESTMGEVAHIKEISARSDSSFEDAVKLGIEHANRTLRNVRSAWIKEERVDVHNEEIVLFQVNLLVTYIVD